MVQSRMMYCILTWGFDYYRIEKLQKRFVRIITSSKYNAHSEPLFKVLDILKIEHLFSQNCLKFVYKFKKCQLPKYFSSFQCVPRFLIHDHDIYCDIVWHFCSNRSTYKIEKIHKNALQVTLNDYTSSYSDMLELVKRPTLYISRIKNIAIETFEGVKGLNPKYMGSLFSFSSTPYCTRGGFKLVQPKVNTISYGINTFAYQGFKIWNNLPQGVKDTTCLIACKDLIVKCEEPTSKCGFCIMCNMSKI